MRMRASAEIVLFVTLATLVPNGLTRGGTPLTRTLMPSVGLKSQDAPAEKIDKYYDLNCEDEMAILDSYAVKLQSRQELEGYIIVYGGQNGRRGELDARMSRVSHYLRTNRMIPMQRFRMVKGGYRQRLTVELWLIARGAPHPRLSPSLQPSEVKYKRGRMEKWEYTCDSLG
jgi:hypothetical protein